METPTNKPVLKASEVERFAYCSVAWHLERQGYKPESSALEKSLEEHADLGAKIESLSKAERTSKQLSSMSTDPSSVSYPLAGVMSKPSGALQ